MDFFARQESARRRTWWLVVLFFTALAGIIATAYLAVMAIAGAALTDTDTITGLTTAAAAPRWDPGLFAAVSSVISLVVFGGTSYKLAQLRQGGTVVADMLGGRRINPATTQFHERRLLNVVEEMALASGVPVPPVYVMPGQMGINAFAAGYSINDAVVGITEGAMRGLKREELQGVVGHEFSHILNGDMRLNIRLIGILHGLLVLAIVGRLLVRFSGSSRSSGGKKGGAGLLFVALGLALIIIGYAGYFFGGLIKRAVSRQREYLADASAVQFTRSPSGLASALKKIGGLAKGGQIANPRAEELSHMFFADGVKRFFGSGSLFATHPPLAKRIKAIDPSFDGEFPIITPDMLAFSGRDSEETPSKVAEAKGREFIRRTVVMGGDIQKNPQQILTQAGVLSHLGMDTAGHLLSSLPPQLHVMSKEPIGAQALMLAMVLGTTNQESSPFAWTWLPPFLSTAVDRAVELLAKVGPEQRLPLVEMSLPALREVSRDQAIRFMETLEEIIKADNRVDLFEFAIREIIRAGLREAMGEPVGRISVTSINREVEAASVTLLSLLAHSGAGGDQAKAEMAFASGVAELGLGDGHTLRPIDLLTMDDASKALQLFLITSMLLRQRFLNAALACLQTDQQITIGEAELFRSIAAVMEVPVPPLVEVSAGG